ncbi:MAG: hypothetical protein MJY60_04790 [Bacteroidales bacterium]|nr:hypothetical protein [Bacteroidales bacterium]
MIRKHPCITALAAIVLASACQPFSSEDAPVPRRNGEAVRISATFEQQKSATRTTLDSDGKVLWSKGDEFALISAAGNERFSIISGEGTGSATFSGNAAGEGPYYALYPYSDDCSIQDGSLRFSLPQEQNTAPGTFGPGASPSLATLGSLTEPAVFKNLCGLLELNLCGSSLKLASVEICDLSGAPLWGDCEVALDGKQGTDEQTFSISGGSNVLRINLDKPYILMASTPRVIYAAVPQDALSHGLSVRAFDFNGNALAFLTTVSGDVRIRRSFITSMNKVKLTAAMGEPKDSVARGFYKDVFMDGGVYLTSRTTLPAVTDLLKWDMEYLATGEQDLQNGIMIGNEQDSNGALLYPDGEPRFRVIYVNGGAASHGNSLGAEGRQRIATYYKNGGGYVGSCAGMFLAANGVNDNKLVTAYFHLWPGNTYDSNMYDTTNTHVLEPGCPLLNYYNFGGDMKVEGIYHNNGGYMSEIDPIPAGTEILMRYKGANANTEGKVSCWAYKANEKSGRLVVIGSHPEGETSGEKRDLFAAMIHYAADGAGAPQAKGNLSNGVVRSTKKGSLASYAPIGDRQYHHYQIKLPSGAKDMKVELSSSYSGNLYLALRRDAIAWLSDAEYFLANPGSTKTLNIDSLPAGTWFVSIYCPDTPKAKLVDRHYEYSENIEPLNGVNYSIKASWK